jgi:MoaA/NifB/PqqE/SkfB family radical SAM enzyme
MLCGKAFKVIRKTALLKNRSKIFAGLLMYRYFGRTRPIFAHLLLTNRCNLNCRYCFVDVNTIYETDLTLKEWKDVVLGLYRRGCVSISLMGGEPLMFKELDALVDYIKSLGLNVDLTTNGIGLTKRLDIVRKINSVMVSLDGPKSVHEINRGKNSFMHAMNAIDALKENKIPVRVNCIVNRQNRDELPWLLEFSKTNRIPITFNMANEFSESKRHFQDEIMLSEHEIREFYRNIGEYMRSDPTLTELILFSGKTIDHVVNYPKAFNELILREEGEKLDRKEMCWFGQIWVHINSNGDIIPCSTLWNLPHLFTPMNIREHGLGVALDHATKLPCKTCYWPAPYEWKEVTTPRGALKRLGTTFVQMRQ